MALNEPLPTLDNLKCMRILKFQSRKIDILALRGMIMEDGELDILIEKFFQNNSYNILDMFDDEVVVQKTMFPYFQITAKNL